MKILNRKKLNANSLELETLNACISNARNYGTPTQQAISRGIAYTVRKTKTGVTVTFVRGEDYRDCRSAQHHKSRVLLQNEELSLDIKDALKLILNKIDGSDMPWDICQEVPADSKTITAMFNLNNI